MRFENLYPLSFSSAIKSELLTIPIFGRTHVTFTTPWELERRSISITYVVTTWFVDVLFLNDREIVDWFKGKSRGY